MNGRQRTLLGGLLALALFGGTIPTVGGYDAMSITSALDPGAGQYQILSFDGHSSTFITTGRAHTFTWNLWSDRSTIDPSPYRSQQGTIPVMFFDGLIGAASPDHDDWHPGATGPLTIGAWIRPTEPVTLGNIFGQYDIDGAGEQRAWLLQIETSANGATPANVIGAFRDEDVSIFNVIKPRTTWPTDQAWHHLAVSIEESGGTFTGRVYVDGVDLDTDSLSDPNFLAIRNIAQEVGLGTFFQLGLPIQPYYGYMAGGICGPFWTNKLLSAAEWTEYLTACRAAMELDVNTPQDLDSLYKIRASQWPAYYTVMEQQLGATATLIPFGDQQNAGKVNATTFTGMKFNASGLSPTWTPSEALSAWDTAFDLANPSNWLGLAPILTWNGTDEEMDTPDDAYWFRNDAAAEAWSVGFWVKVDDTAATRCLIARWNSTVAIQTYQITIESTDVLRVLFRDDSAGLNVTRTTDAVVPQGAWMHVVVTYDGSGGATAMNGVTVYINGAAVASTAANNASYVGMENGSTVTMLGHTISTGPAVADFFDGQMLGGPWAPWNAQIQLTAAQVANIHARMRLGLGI